MVNNPLALYRFKAGFYIYASTEAILESTLKGLDLAKYPHEKIETDCGDILKIDARGNLSRSKFEPSDDYFYPYHCSWKGCLMHDSECEIQLKDFANTFGIATNDIDLLLDYGFDTDEISELIYEPGAFQDAVDMVLEFCYVGAFR